MTQTTKNLLLIGVTQSGKSTLANFLFHGRIWFDDEVKYPMGTGFESCTRVPTHHILQYQKGPIRIIDTPGMGDTTGSAAEEENMMMLYSTLSKFIMADEELSCAILVVRFPSLFNEGYKKNVFFYKQMFPALFQKNVVLIVTGFEVSDAWEKQQKRAGNDPVRVLLKCKEEIKKMLQVDHDIAMWAINSLYEEGTQDERIALDLRRLLLNRCFTADGHRLDKIKLPKPPTWRERDLSEAETCKREKESLTKGMKLTDMDASLGTLADELTGLNLEIQELEEKINDWERSIKEKNNEDQVELYSKTFTDTWHIFFRASREFDIPTSHKIEHIIWTDGIATYTTKEDYHIKGYIEKDGIWKDLSASLTLLTKSNSLFAKEIANCRTEISIAQPKLFTLRNQYRALLEKQSELKKLNEALLEYDEKIKLLSEEFVPTERLQEWLDRSHNN